MDGVFDQSCGKNKSTLIKYIFIIILATTAPSISLASFDSLNYSSDQENRYAIEKLQNQLQQAEFDRQIDALNRQTEILRQQQEDEEIKSSLEAAEQARQVAENEAREAAEAAAADFQNEILRSSIKTKNNLYFIFTMITAAGFLPIS